MPKNISSAYAAQVMERYIDRTGKHPVCRTTIWRWKKKKVRLNTTTLEFIKTIEWVMKEPV